MNTYRFQFNDGKNVDNRNPDHTRFTLADATALVPYLHGMGVTHIYASPLTQAEKGQNHGYGVTDYNKIDEDLGGIEGLRTLSAELKKHDMGLMLDIVPNHMYTSYDNEWWRDVLAKGEKSDYSGHFEIDWSKDKILLPDLGDQFGYVFDDGHLKLQEEENGDITLNYWSHKYPINPRHFHEIKQPANGDVAGYWNKPGEGAWHRKEALRALVKKQSYRLEDWRTGHGEGSYRRFFDINSLVGVMQEKPHVFADSHRLVKQLVNEGLVQGFRVDHIDGLASPRGYTTALRDLIGPNIPIVVEKIVEGNERLLADLPVNGMTGYEFLNDALRLHGDEQAGKKIDRFYRDFTGEQRPFPELLNQAKKLILHRAFSSEMETLVNDSVDIAHTSDYSRGLTPLAIGDALRAVLINFQVYRSYNEGNEFAAQDLQELEHAIEAAKNPRNGPPKDCRAIDFVGNLLTGKYEHNQYGSEAVNDVVRKFQQLTGPVMARSSEDTSFYRYNRNIGLNEVGGNPDEMQIGAEKFHYENVYRLINIPLTLNTLQTHDTKLGHDSRTRIMAALNQFTDEFVRDVPRWEEMNRATSGQMEPDKNDKLRFYQALLGTWPADMTALDDPRLPDYTERMVQYMDKAIKEAKIHTTWTETNAGYEDATSAYIRRVLDPQNVKSRKFMREFMNLQQDVAAAAAIDSLGDEALKIGSVGTPDNYNGGELWDTAFVDPDNRRAVDYSLRQENLAALEQGKFDVPSLKAQWQNGLIKTETQRVVGTLRRDNPAIFAGDYKPVYADNPKDNNRFTAFVREKDGAGILIVAPRHVSGHVNAAQLHNLDLGDAYSGVTVHVDGLPPNTTLTDEFTQKTFVTGDQGAIDLHVVLRDMPVGVLTFDTTGQDRIKHKGPAPALPA